MGNCISGDHSKAEYETEPPLDQVENRDYDPNDAHPTSPSNATTANNTPFLGTPDHTMAMKSNLEKSFLIQKSLSRDEKKSSMSSSSSSSTTSSPSKEELLFNPRLVPLLEFFSHLYLRKKDLFRRVISIHGERLVDVFLKVGQVEEKIERPIRIEGLQRSRSAGPTQDLKNEKFKMKTFNPDEGQPPPLPSTQGGNNNGGSKPSK